MLRWMTPLLAAIFAIGTAAADDTPAPKSADSPAAKSTDGIPASKGADGAAVPKRAAPKNAAVRAARNLPPGLPRPHYRYRTTVAPGAAPLYVRRGRTLVVEEEDPDVLFTPVGVVPYAPRVYGTPLLPGSSTLPGYYGTSHSYSYDGPYYGGPSYGPYWNRLPYACGVYGYC
jgi:hypothetical protein